MNKTRIENDFRAKEKDDFMMMIKNDKKNAEIKRLIIKYHCSSSSTKLLFLIRSIKEDLISEFRNSEMSESRFLLIRLASDRLFNFKASDMKR